MTAVRQDVFRDWCEIARDVEVQKGVSRGRMVSGKLQVDVGRGVGVQGLARVDRIAGGKDG